MSSSGEWAVANDNAQVHSNKAKAFCDADANIIEDTGKLSFLFVATLPMNAFRYYVG
jgi:hypothetical protein